MRAQVSTKHVLPISREESTCEGDGTSSLALCWVPSQTTEHITYFFAPPAATCTPLLILKAAPQQGSYKHDEGCAVAQLAHKIVSMRDEHFLADGSETFSSTPHAPSWRHHHRRHPWRGILHQPRRGRTPGCPPRTRCTGRISAGAHVFAFLVHAVNVMRCCFKFVVKFRECGCLSCVRVWGGHLHAEIASHCNTHTHNPPQTRARTQTIMCAYRDVHYTRG